MTETRYPTFSEITGAHGDKREYERYLPVSRFLFRPAGFVVTWLAVRAGVSSEAVSWLSGAAACAGFCFLSSGREALLPAGIGFLFLFNLLDCVDGGIARVMKTRNPYGRFLDSIMSWADMIFWGVIGFTVWQIPSLRQAGDSFGIFPGVWLAAGTASAFLSTYEAYLDGIFDQVLLEHWETLLRGEGVRTASTPIAGKSGPEAFVRALAHNLRVRETHYVLLAAAYALGCADLLLAFFLAVNAAFVAALLFVYCRRGRKIFGSGLGSEKAG